MLNILFVSMKINDQLSPIRINERIGKRGLPIKSHYVFSFKKSDVTEHDLCQVSVDIPSLPFHLRGWAGEGGGGEGVTG